MLRSDLELFETYRHRPAEPLSCPILLPTTVAEPNTRGGYRLTGQKVFIGNGTIADELIVSAVVPGRAGSPSDACLFLVDTRSPGFRVHSAQEVIGLKGAPLGMLDLCGVDVPPERVISGPGVHWRDTRLLEPVSSRGRTYLVSGAAAAIARRCLDQQRDFARRRTINGRPLHTYPAVQRLTARSLADLYAVDTAVRWGLIGPAALTSRHQDRYATKNTVTAACWRIVDRTVSLPAADHTAPRERRLSTPNQRHLTALANHARRLARALTDVAPRAEEHASQPAVIAVGRIAGELLTGALVLARCADAPKPTADQEQHLADSSCTTARERLAAAWHDLTTDPAPHTELSAWWHDDPPPPGRPWD